MFHLESTEGYLNVRGKGSYQQVEHMQVPNGTGPGVRRTYCPLLASHAFAIVLWKPLNFWKKVNLVLMPSIGLKSGRWRVVKLQNVI